MPFDDICMPWRDDLSTVGDEKGWRLRSNWAAAIYSIKGIIRAEFNYDQLRKIKDTVTSIRGSLALKGSQSGELDSILAELELIDRMMPLLTEIPFNDISLTVYKHSPARIIVNPEGPPILNETAQLLDMHLVMTSDVRLDIAKCLTRGEALTRVTYIEVAPGRDMPARVTYEQMGESVLMSITPLIN